LFCWFDLVGVRAVFLQGWPPTSVMRECGAVFRSKSTSNSFLGTIARFVQHLMEICF
jgi:hypothetical protein